MKKLVKCILVEVDKEAKSIKGRKDGNELKLFAHTFMTEEGKELKCWLKNDAWRSEVTPTLTWNEKLAKNWLFNSQTLDDGSEKLYLVYKEDAEAFLKTVNNGKPF